MTSPNMDSESPATQVVEKGSTPSKTTQSGSKPTKKSQGKVPKRVHKAEREKMKREHLNDLFLSLANALELSEQAAGKAAVLNEATRSVKDLLAQIEELKKENAALLSESEYVSMEKQELQDEISVYEAKISKLNSKIQSEMNERTVESNLDLNLAPPGYEQEALPSHVIPDEPGFQNPPVYVYPFSPDPQVYTPAPDSDPLAGSTVSKPLARYPTPADVWPSEILGKRPRLEKGI